MAIKLTEDVLCRVVCNAYRHGTEDERSKAKCENHTSAAAIKGYFQRRREQAYGPAYNGDPREFERSLEIHLLHHLGLT